MNDISSNLSAICWLVLFVMFLAIMSRTTSAPPSLDELRARQAAREADMDAMYREFYGIETPDDIQADRENYNRNMIASVAAVSTLPESDMYLDFDGNYRSIYD